jgi:hypothetical protein
MKKEVIVIPKEKFFLDFIAEMGAQIKESWMFIDRRSLNEIRRSADNWCLNNSSSIPIEWHERKYPPKRPERKMCINETFPFYDWNAIISIEDPAIDYSEAPHEPKKFFFFTLEGVDQEEDIGY